MPLPPLLQKRALALQRQLLSASLLQELETFLKRKGVQKSDSQHGSFNDEENVLSFDGKEKNVRLEEKFCLDDLLRLEEIFANHNHHEETGGRRKAVPSPQGGGNMTLKEFQKVLSDLFGSQFWDHSMELLFNKVDTSCDGLIDWSEFCTYMLLQYKEREVMMTRRGSVLGEPIIRLCTHSKQEPTCRILTIGGPPSFCFMSVSKGGVLTTWDGGLNPLRSYEISSDPHDPQAGKRRFKSWTTDAIYLSNLHKFVVSTTSRNIHFFDISTMNMSEEFYLCALQHVPTCFSYWYNVKTPGSSSLLLWGDDKGGVSLLWLLKPTSGLFEKPFSQQPGPHKISMQDLRHHSNFLSYQSIPNVHSEPVTRLLYIPGQELIISASGSSKTSVVIMDIHKRGRVYTWKINKGVQCFDFCKAMNLLVTGGRDHQVRLWNQYVPDRPTAVLSGHTMPILDVVVYEPLRQIFSYSKDSVLKVWDISSHSCLQTLLLKFPCIQPGRIQEQGNFPFLLVPSPPSYCLLVSYCDYIAMLRLAQTSSGDEVLVTHEAPLSSVLYNGFFHQVVTASEDSSIAVWDVETGDKFLLLRNAHGQEEVTCLSLDTSRRRLFSGAQNGTIKIWNIQNGHNLHRLQPVGEGEEVTRVVSLRENTVLGVGWNRKIVTYNVTNTEKMYVPADEGWKGGHLHKDDIMAADYCPSLGLLVTASFDGEIIVWNVETQRLYLYLRKCPLYRQSSRGRAGSRYCQRGRSGDLGCPTPVDRLLFLQYRAAQREGAVLISSEGGVLCWWSIFPPDSIFGSFYAPREAEESVFGITSDDSNRLLVSGDTSGNIQVWDISQYGLHPQDQVKGTRPPLLFRWAAHNGTVVSLEIFQFGAESFIVSGSCDRTAKLWTGNGSHVGTFGQSRAWNLKNPSTFQQNISSRTPEYPDVLPEGLQSHSGEEGAAPGGTVQRGWPLPEPDSESMCELADTEEESSSDLRLPENHMKVSAGRNRSKRCPIDLHKCSLYGQLCTPFQALHVAEMAEVPTLSHGPSGLLVAPTRGVSQGPQDTR